MEQLKKIKWNLIGTSAICVLLGVILIIFPAAVNEMIIYILAAGMFLLSGFEFYSFFSRKSDIAFFRNDLVFAVASLVIAIIILTKKELLISLIPMVFGIFIIISGVKKLQNAIDLLRLKMGGWLTVLILSAINILFGIIMICNAFETATVVTILIGIGLVYSGLTDIFSTLWVSNRAKKTLKETDDFSNEE